MEGLKCLQIFSNRNLIAQQKSSKHNTFLSKLILVKSLICCSIQQLIIRDVCEHGHSYTDGRAADVDGVVRVGGLDVELQDVVNKRGLD